MKYLIVVDMQNDFISGALGSREAASIVPAVKELVEGVDGRIIFTRDTHFEDYLDTREGRRLPVRHCIKDTDGWQICDELKPYVNTVVDKITFGGAELADILRSVAEPTEITLCGLCTDICVISNAMLLKAQFPEVDIKVVAAGCAGVTPESHLNALSAMKAVQIDIV